MASSPCEYPRLPVSPPLPARGRTAGPVIVVLIFGGTILFLWWSAVHSGLEKAVPPEELLGKAWEAFRQIEFEKAARLFQIVESSTPEDSETHIEAIYGEASCANHRRSGRDLKRALALYEAIQKQHPASLWAPWAALAAVRASHLEPSDLELPYKKLSSKYVKVYQEHPNTPAGEEAFLYHCRIIASLGSREEASKLLREIDDFLSRHPGAVYQPLLDAMAAECYHILGREDDRIEAMARSIAAFERDPTVPFYELSSAYWNVAYAAEFEAGNFAVARKYYELFLKEFPNEDRAFGCRQALARIDRVEKALREGKQPEAEWLAVPCQ